jgi:hypothetical protein
MRRAAFVIVLLVCLANACAAIADVQISGPSTSAQFQPSSCVVTGPTRDGTGWWQNVVFVWRVIDADGTRSYQTAVSAISLGTVTPLGALPAPPGWTWHEDVQVCASAGSTDMGSCCVCGMLRSTTLPRTYAVGTLRGYVSDSTNVLWDAPKVMQIVPPLGSSLYVGELTIDSHRESNFVTLVHSSNFTSTTPSYWMRQSFDGGDTWHAPVPVANDSTKSTLVGVVCGARPGDAWVVWGEIGTSTQTLKSRRATADGLGFELPAVVGTAPYVLATGPHGDYGQNALGLDANRDTLSVVADQLYLATSFGLTPSTLDFPAVDTAPSRVEIEPNGNSSSALGIPALGTVLRGSISATSVPADTDYYAVSLTAGQYVAAWPDSATSGALIDLNWVGSDGWSVLSDTFVQTQPMGLVAPVAGTYFLRVTALFGALPVGYRVRTMTGPAPASGTRDQGDLFTWQNFMGAWTPPINLSAQVSGVGTNQSGVALSANFDGCLYASWYDWGVTPGADVTQRLLSRSPDGGGTWEAPVVISSAPSPWKTATLAPASLVRPWAIGLRPSISSDGMHMCIPWTDARSGDPDVFATVVDRSIDVTPLTSPVYTVHPGDLILVSYVMHNHDSFFGWHLSITGHAVGRAWTLPFDGEPLAAGGSLGLGYVFTVPDTAVAGEVGVDLQFASSQHPAATLHLDITVLPGALSAHDQAPQLALAPPMPNPASSVTRIGFSLPRAADVRLEVFGVDGRRVRTLVRGSLAAGVHSHEWKGEDAQGRRVPSGAYFVSFSAEGRQFTRRIAWMK